MKHTIASIALLLFGSAHAGITEEFADATYGLHLVSEHADNRGTNNGNFGVYVRTKSGWTAGQYANSCHTVTNYFGWTTPEWYRMRLSPVIASGYQCLTEVNGVSDGRRWNLSIVPTVRIATWENVGPAKEVSIRAMLAPGLYHLMAEGRF
jgi:hypothetical protein